MATPKNIVVGVDGSDDGLRAAEYAAVEAQIQGAGIRLVHAVQLSVGVGPIAPSSSYALDDGRAAGAQALAAAELRVAQIDASIPVERLLSSAPRAQALVDAGRRAALIVVGRRSVRGIERLLTGSTSTAVAARARVPVVSVPSTWSRAVRARRLVVGSDGSPQGQDAIAFAFAEATRRRHALVVVRAWEVPVRWYADTPPFEGEVPEWEERARISLAEDLAGWSELYPDVPVVRHVERCGSAAQALAAHTDDAAMLVVGARGTGGLPGLDLGWTARSVLAHAGCPVVVVHRGDVLRRSHPLAPAAAAR